jgi:hypothetical protein
LPFNLGGSSISTCYGHRVMIFGFLPQNVKMQAVYVAFSIAWLKAGVEPQPEDRASAIGRQGPQAWRQRPDVA